MKRNPKDFGKIILLSLILFLTLAAQELYAAEDMLGEPKIVVKDGMMALSSNDCPLSVLLERIESQSKVSFILHHSLQQERISIAFGSMPFLKGLKRILSHMSYLFFFDRSSKLVQVVVIEKRKGYLPVTRSPSIRSPRTYGLRSQNWRASSPNRIRGTKPASPESLRNRP